MTTSKLAELRLLVVEDDDFQRQTLSNMLRSLGVVSVEGAANGRKALEMIRDAGDYPFEVALCDLNMPEMDGMEFLRHLSEEQRSIAIIITSALDKKLLASVGRMTRIHGIQLLGTIEKPIMLAQLKELLAKYDQSVEPANPGSTNTNHFTLEHILHGIHADQFEPYFQPKVDMKSGRIVGAEALARWKHPEHGIVGPYSFIPLLEQSGNIDELTFMMLRKATTFCRTLHDRGHLLTMSVNLSLTSLGDPQLADKITQLVRKGGIEPQYVVLEITESSAMTDAASALENLARMCMNGFSLSIDDYGTGYSSLQQLTRIAFSELKIDQSFVKDFSDNDAMRIVVESSIDMAHKLRVKSVAEGVERQQEWDTLETVGCDTVQGYLIAKPMDAGAFTDFIASYAGKSAATSSKSLPDQDKIHILVVDDDDFTRKIFIRVLQDFGYSRISDARSAEEAIRLFESNKFDLIVTDIDMPGMNGIEFVQRIRSGKAHARPDARIMVLSSFSQPEVLGSAFALDINGFLVKPIIPAVVYEKISQALSERLHLRAPIAYEAVKTRLLSLPNASRQAAEPSTGGAAITLNARKLHKEGEGVYTHGLAIQRLKPGMVLNDNLYLADGSLLLSSGHTFTELSINRLNDLRALLNTNNVSIQEQLL